MADNKAGVMDRVLDMLDHQNDKRVVVFVVGVGAIVWLGYKPSACGDTMFYLAMLTALAIAGISFRPEKSKTVEAPVEVKP